MLRYASLIVVFTTIRTAALADPICADRPGKASATCTVPAGHLQVETGFADWTLDRAGSLRTSELALGATAVKYGISDSAHIELDLTPYVRDSIRDGGVREHASGVGDVVARFKRRLTGDGAALAVSAYPFVKLPTAGDRLGNGKVEGGLVVPVAYSLPRSPVSVTLGPELDWAADADGSGHHLAMAQVASLGIALGSRLSLSGELWRQWDRDPGGTTRQASADASIAFLPRSDLQLDAGANVGLNRATPDLELYAGVSKLF